MHYIDGSVQERRNPSALTLELRRSCTNPSIYRRIRHLGFCKIMDKVLSTTLIYRSTAKQFCEEDEFCLLVACYCNSVGI